MWIPVQTDQGVGTFLAVSVSFNSNALSQICSNNALSSIASCLVRTDHMHQSVTDRLLDRLNPQDSLKPRIEKEAQSKLQMQFSKLEKIFAKLREKGQVIFKRVVHSLQNHDSHC